MLYFVFCRLTALWVGCAGPRRRPSVRGKRKSAWNARRKRLPAGEEPILSCRIISYHIISCHIVSYHIRSNQKRNVLWYNIVSCHTIRNARSWFYHIVSSYHCIACWYHIVLYCIVLVSYYTSNCNKYHVKSYHIVSYHIISSYRIISYHSFCVVSCISYHSRSDQILSSCISCHSRSDQILS